MKGLPNYSSFDSVSFGESLARQGDATEEQMGEDRRVEVHCSLNQAPKPPPGPKPPAPPAPVMVKRFLSRTFQKFTASGNRGDSGDDSLKQGVKSVLDLLRSAVDPEAALGSEITRSVGQVDATHCATMKLRYDGSHRMQKGPTTGPICVVPVLVNRGLNLLEIARLAVDLECLRTDGIVDAIDLDELARVRGVDAAMVRDAHGHREPDDFAVDAFVPKAVGPNQKRIKICRLSSTRGPRT